MDKKEYIVKIDVANTSYGFHAWDEDSVLFILKRLAKESGDPINWVYFLEKVLYKLTEDFGWLEK